MEEQVCYLAAVIADFYMDYYRRSCVRAETGQITAKDRNKSAIQTLWKQTCNRTPSTLLRLILCKISSMIWNLRRCNKMLDEHARRK